MIVSNYRQYQTLSYVPTLEPGDLLIKKVFPETAKGAVEKGITFGQKLYRTDDVVKISHGRFKRTETFTFKNQGSHTSEHAAIALGGGMIAEAIENGVITASISTPGWMRSGAASCGRWRRCWTTSRRFATTPLTRRIPLYL
jgi:hypothetical protein